MRNLIRIEDPRSWSILILPVLLSDLFLRWYFRMEGVCTENHGVVFGFGPPRILSGLVLIILILSLLTLRIWGTEILLRTGLIFLTLGGVSNLLERSIYQSICDYINLPFDLMVNGADIIVSIGVIMVLWDIILNEVNLGSFIHRRR